MMILVFVMVIYYIIEEVVHVLQCVAVWCSVVQCSVVWCSVLQCVGVCLWCSALQ